MKLLVFLSVVCFLSGCGEQGRVESAPELQPTPANTNQGGVEKLKDRLPNRATLVAGPSTEWNISQRRLGRDDFIDVFFVDADVGWIVAIEGDTLVPSGGSLYNTSDGGRTWKRLPLKLLTSSYISRVSFVDRSRGWLIVQTIDRQATKMQVMETSDGGATWTPRFSLPKAIASEMLFDKNGEGWIIGIRGEAIYVHGRTNLVLNSRDFGRSWREVTPTSETRDIGGMSAVPFEDVFTDILLEDGSQLAAISRDGSISTTTDNGLTWKFLTKLDIREQHSQGFSRLARIGENGFVALSGANGPEGVWSTFTSDQKDRERKSILLPRISITDMDFDSLGLMASGLKKSDSNNESKPPTSAVILSTRDLEEWSLLFEVSIGCEFGCRFNEISRRGEGYVIVGSDGLIVTMDRRN